MPTIIKIKKRDNPFAQIDKNILEDTKLSWKAKGLLTYLLSKPADWKVYLEEISEHSTDGIASTTTAFKELKERGYVQKMSQKNERGQIIGWETIVSEIPNLSIDALPEKPQCGKTTMWKNHNVEKPQCGKTTMWKNHNVEKPQCGKTQTTNKENTNKENTNKENTNKENTNKENIYSIFEHWNSKKIIIHKELTQAIRGHINAKLEHYTPEEIMQAIDNYATVVNGEEYFWTYKWPLGTFLTRANGFVNFLTVNNPLGNFKKKGNPDGTLSGNTAEKDYHASWHNAYYD